jgi:peptidoglycan/LPS O-acetylase OafA/YrhL
MGATVAGMVLVKGSYDYGQESPFGVMLNNVVLPGAIMLLFAGLLTEPTGFRRFLSTPLLQLLGKSSYAFYLVHVGFFQELLRDHLATGNGMADLLLAFVVLNALALALYYLVEQPLNQFIRRLGGRRPLPALS